MATILSSSASVTASTILPVGSFSKNGGQAHYVIATDQTVTYTNRRGESSPSTSAAFLKAMAAGFCYSYEVHGIPTTA